MPRDQWRVGHIIEVARYAVEFLEGKTVESIDESIQLKFALYKIFEIIGEAAVNISQETKDKYPNVSWKQMIGMRNILVHNYFDIDASTVWDTVKNDLPLLIADLEQLMPLLPKDSDASTKSLFPKRGDS